LNYYRRYMADYLSKTASLSLAEHGAYCLLLDYAYLAEGGLSGDVDELCRMVRAVTPAERQAVSKVLDRFFVLYGNAYSNPRVSGEIAKAKPAMEAARANGVKGGRPKNNPVGFEIETQTEPRDNPEGTQTEPSAKASQPLAPNHQPPTAKPPSARNGAKAPVAATPLPDWIEPEKWRSWLAIRPAKARSDAAQRAALDKLAAWKALGMDPNVIVGESLANGWQGLFLPKAGGITGGMTLGQKNRAAADEAVRRMEAEQHDQL